MLLPCLAGRPTQVHSGCVPTGIDKAEDGSLVLHFKVRNVPIPLMSAHGLVEAMPVLMHAVQAGARPLSRAMSVGTDHSQCL